MPLQRAFVRFHAVLLLTLIPSPGGGDRARAADAVHPRQFGTMYPDPPYEFREVRSVTFRFKTSPDVLRKLVPEPLVPNKDGAMWMFAGRQRSPTLGEYDEVIIGIPARLGDRAGSYILTMYLDETVPIVVGRERSGWPKKDAAIVLTEKDGLFTASVTRGRKVLIRASAKLGEALDPAALDKVTPTWFVLKEIPSARRGAAPEVLQLVAVTPQGRRTRSAAAARGSLELHGSPSDPLDAIPVLEVTGAALSVVDQDLAGGEIVHDYLGDRALGAAAASRP